MKILNKNDVSQHLLEKLALNAVIWISNHLDHLQENLTEKVLFVLKEAIEVLDKIRIENLRNSGISQLLQKLSSKFNICNEIILSLVNEQSKSESLFNSFPIYEEKYSLLKQDTQSFKESKSNLLVVVNQNEQKLFENKSDFDSIDLLKEDEQKLFDLMINIKFGDSLTVSKNLNMFYNQIINDFPIEYFLINCDLLKILLVIAEKSDFYEFGFIIFKIFFKLLNKIKQKESYFTDNKHSFLCEFPKENDNTIFYPKTTTNNINNNNNNNNKNNQNKEANFTNLNNCLSIRDYLLLAMEAFLLGSKDKTKISLYFELFESYLNYFEIYCLKNKSKKDVKNVIVHIINKLFDLIEHFQKEKLFLDKLNLSFIKFICNLHYSILEEILLKENIAEKIKIVLFTLDNNTKNIKVVINLLNKLEVVDSKTKSNEIKLEIEKIIKEYGNAEMCFKAIIYLKEPKNSIDFTFFKFNIDFILMANKYLTDVSSLNYKNEIFSFFENFENVKIKEDYDDLILKVFSYNNFNFSIQNAFNFYKEINESKLKNFLINENTLLFLINDLYKVNNETKVIINELIACFINLRINDLDVFSVVKISKVFPLNNLEDAKLINCHCKIDLKIKNEDSFALTKKYLKFLFHKNSEIRLKAVKYFLDILFKKKNDKYNKNKNYSLGLLFDYSENIEHSLNYLIENDVEKAIITAQRELNSLILNIKKSNSNFEIYPLINILLSNKSDCNLKINAMDQLFNLIKNDKFKDIFIDQILPFLLKQIESAIFNKSIDDLNLDECSKYFNKLLSFLNLIIYFHFDNVSILNFLEKSSLNFVVSCLNFVFLSLLNTQNIQGSKQILASNVITLIYFITFNEHIKTNNGVYSILNIINEDYYSILENLEVDYNVSLNKFDWENKQVDRYIIDYISSKESKAKMFKKNEILDNLNCFLTVKRNENDYLNIYLSSLNFTNYLIFNETYAQEFSNLINYLRFTGLESKEEKHIIIDILAQINIFIKISKDKNNNNTNKNFSKLSCIFEVFPDIFKNLLNLVLLDKQFFNNLNKKIENEALIIEIFNFVYDNINIFSNLIEETVILALVDTLSSFLILENNFYSINLSFIKLATSLLSFYSKKEVFIPILNSIDFYLSKLTFSKSFENLSFVLNSLNFIKKFSSKFASLDLKFTYNIIKLLDFPFLEVINLSLVILKQNISQQFLESNPLLFNLIYDKFNSLHLPNVVKINLINFMVKTLEMIIKTENDLLKNQFTTINDQIISEIGILRIFQLSQLTDNPLLISQIFKFIKLTMIIKNDEMNFESVFLNSNFYDLILFNLKKQVSLNNSYLVESTIAINEILSLLLKSIVKLTMNSLVSSKKQSIIEVLINIINFGKLTLKNKADLSENLIKSSNLFSINLIFSAVFEDFAKKYFTFLHFHIYNDENFILSSLSFYPSSSSLILKTTENDIEFSKKKSNFNDSIYDYLNLNLNLVLLKEDEVSSENSKDLSYFKILFHDLNLNLNFKILSLKQEENLFLVLMTSLKSIYNIQIDPYNKKDLTFKFELKDFNLSDKNIVLKAISYFLYYSFTAKKIFVKTKFINTFCDYVKQLSAAYFDLSLQSNKLGHLNCKKEINNNNNNSNNLLTSNSKISSNITKAADDNDNNNNNKEDDILSFQYIEAELISNLKLFQNLFFNFKECEERSSLFESNSFFLKFLFDLFYLCLKNESVFEEYFKLLINVIYKNDQAKVSFLNNIKNNKECLLSLIINHFNCNLSLILTTNSSNNSSSSFSGSKTFEMIVKFLKSELQNKISVNFLLKSKFLSKLTNEVVKIVKDQKFIKNFSCLEQILKLQVAFSFETDVFKKIITKEYIESLMLILTKTKNENILYYIFFIFRNISFVNKSYFNTNEQLIGLVLAFLENESIKIKFMLSHLLFSLIYNNQAVNIK